MSGDDSASVRAAGGDDGSDSGSDTDLEAAGTDDAVERLCQRMAEINSVRADDAERAGLAPPSYDKEKVKSWVKHVASIQ